MIYVGNEFAPKMLADKESIAIIKEIKKVEFDINVYGNTNCKSVVSHEDIARLLDVSFNPCNVYLFADDELYVAQYSGQKLPKSATKLPSLSSFKYYRVKVIYV